MRRPISRSLCVLALVSSSLITLPALADPPPGHLLIGTEASHASPPIVRLRDGEASGTHLHWSIRSQTPGPVQLTIEVLDAAGHAVRHLDARIDRLPSGIMHGSTRWDGKDDSGATATPGIYHYRVVAVDEAGNVSQSGESKPLQVKVG